MTWELFECILHDMKALNHKVKNFNCSFYRLRGRANGDVTAMCCDAIRDVEYDNILENGLQEIWNGPAHRIFLKMRLTGYPFNPHLLQGVHDDE